jgi:hypothetical protein
MGSISRISKFSSRQATVALGVSIPFRSLRFSSSSAKRLLANAIVSCLTHWSALKDSPMYILGALVFLLFITQVLLAEEPTPIVPLQNSLLANFRLYEMNRESQPTLGVG